MPLYIKKGTGTANQLANSGVLSVNWDGGGSSTAGNTLVVIASARESGTNAGMQGEAGFTGLAYQHATSQTGAKISVFYRRDAPSVSSLAITLVSGGPADMTVTILELPPTLTTALHQNVGTGNNSTTPASGNITTTISLQYLLGVVAHRDASSTLSNFTANFNEVSQLATSSATADNRVRSAVYERQVTSTGTYSFGAQINNAEEWAAGILSFSLVNQIAQGVSGTWASTEEDDVSSTTGGIEHVGSLDVTEAVDAPATTGKILYSGTQDSTEQTDTQAATGATRLVGSLSYTDEADTHAATGSIKYSGTLSVTDAGDAQDATGKVSHLGVFDAPEGDDTLFTEYPTFPGVWDSTEADDTQDSIGTTRLAGSLNYVDELDTLIATGATRLIGSLEYTEAIDTQDATGATRWIGAMESVEQGDTIQTGAGFVGVWNSNEDADFLPTGEGDDALGMTGHIRYLAPIAATEGSDVIDLQAKVSYLGLMVVSEANDTLLSVSEIYAGALDGFEEDDTMMTLRTSPKGYWYLGNPHGSENLPSVQGLRILGFPAREFVFPESTAPEPTEPTTPRLDQWAPAERGPRKVWTKVGT